MRANFFSLLLLSLFAAGAWAVGQARFVPPNGPSDFECDYSAMPGWGLCSTPQDRGCWLANDNGGRFDINTTYETTAPIGIVRRYTLEVSTMTLSPDGFPVTEGKVFNKQYPGPWIRACWGDTVEVKVKNSLRYNGTTVHWHGLRQLGSVEQDGVPGVSECPIAPGDEHTYRFNTTQYGTSWYHSHYSLQYADGVLGPLTIFGPTSAEYDEAIDPLLITDWNHRSAFQDFYQELGAPVSPGAPPPPGPPKMTSILLNGVGRYNCTAADKCVTPKALPSSTFKKGRRYLMRIINTSVDTSFVFSIDNHNITVVETDFVPIRPYETDSILVAIGQRYHIVVEADPIVEQADGNYWMRATPADGCNNFAVVPADTVGIVRYNRKSKADPQTARGAFGTSCVDEAYDSLKPVVPWQVKSPANKGDIFEAGLILPSAHPELLPHGNFSRWALGDVPLFLDLDTPTLLHAANDTSTFRKEYVIIDENYGPDDWVYLVITETDITGVNSTRLPIAAAHPIHLHGHDFAILQQSSQPYGPANLDLRFDNPPRRDVALLPSGGFLVIGFKTDNPGTWLMHCHIAWHASSGLALQIMERQKDVVRQIGPRLAENERVCRRWKKWHSNPKNWWNPSEFQDDSGI